MRFWDRLESLRLCMGGALAGDVFAGAFGPLFGLHVSDSTYLAGAVIGFVTVGILQARRVI